MRTWSLVLSIVLFQAGGFVFETEMWPGEGRPVFEASAKTLSLRNMPSTSSPVSKTVAVSPNQRLSFDQARYRTIRAGVVRVVEGGRLRARVLGAINRLSTDDYYSNKYQEIEMDIRPGLKFEYLQYRAEGTCFVRIENKVMDTACPDSGQFKVESQPKTELWIHIKLPDDSAGWLLVDDSTVKEVDRTF